jgi:hypothetical protein
MSYESNRPVRIPIPGLQREVGAGDVIARVTKAFGIQPCAPCEKRRQYLNRILRLRGLR